MVDTHCHLDFRDFDNDRDEVVKNSLETLEFVVNTGAGLKSSEKSVSLADRYDKIYAAVGLHPHDTEPEVVDDFRSQIDSLKRLARESAKVVAIGETGLDYSPAPPGEKDRGKKIQQELFIEQIVLSQELNLPLVVHSRDSIADVMAILRQNKARRVVLHCFTYDVKWAKKVLDAGFLISFTGIVSFKNVKNIHGTVKYVPLERMMLETDAPFLAPEPHRGGRCAPWMVKYVAGRVAELKGISVGEVEEMTDRNARKFFL